MDSPTSFFQRDGGSLSQKIPTDSSHQTTRLQSRHPPRTGIFGSTFTERSHLLALTPHILIETTPGEVLNGDQRPVDRLSYHEANGKGVFMFNKMLANSAHEYLYAQQSDELESTSRRVEAC